MKNVEKFRLPFSSIFFLPGKFGKGGGMPDDVAVVKAGWGKSRGKGSNLAGGWGARKNCSCGLQEISFF